MPRHEEAARPGLRISLRALPRSIAASTSASSGASCGILRSLQVGHQALAFDHDKSSPTASPRARGHMDAFRLIMQRCNRACSRSPAAWFATTPKPRTCCSRYPRLRQFRRLSRAVDIFVAHQRHPQRGARPPQAPPHGQVDGQRKAAPRSSCSIRPPRPESPRAAPRAQMRLLIERAVDDLPGTVPDGLHPRSPPAASHPPATAAHRARRPSSARARTPRLGAADIGELLVKHRAGRRAPDLRLKRGEGSPELARHHTRSG